MSKYIIIGALIVGVAVVAAYGCNGVADRLGVASDNAIAQIDKLLGEINVKEKALTRAIGEAGAQLETMNEKRYEAKARVQLYGKKKTNMEAKKATMVSQLKEIAGLLQSAGDATEIDFKDKSVKVADLNKLAKRAVNEVEALKGQMASNESIYNAWAKNLSALTKNADISKKQLDKFNEQMTKIRAKKDALEGMRTASTISGAEIGVSDKFKQISTDIEELLVSVDSKFEAEMDKVDTRIAEMDEGGVQESLDELLSDGKPDVSSTLSDIEKAIGGN